MVISDAFVIPFYRVQGIGTGQVAPLKGSKESAAIINWIIEGARRFVKNKGEFTRSYTIELLRRMPDVIPTVSCPIFTIRGMMLDGELN